MIQRLDKVLSNGGVGSRREIKDMIKKGLIKVNGIVINDSGVCVNIENDIIIVDEKRFCYKEYIYIMLNKPAGVLSATEDKKCATVLDILGNDYSYLDLFPVGRLDKDTEGLLFLTNNGELAHRLLSPKNHIPKKYFVRVNKKLEQIDIDFLKQGVILENGYRALPGELTIISDSNESEAELVIYEGKFHQIKRMFEALGKRVIYLKRLEMGSLVLDKCLKTGEFRELTEIEIMNLKTLCKLF